MSEPTSLIPRPAPKPTGLDAEFYRHCANGRLCFQRCDPCGTWRHLPRYRCSACGSPEFSWTESSGLGKIYSWTVSHRATHPAFAGATPFAIVVVEMDEGVRVVSGLPGVDPDTIELDQPLQVYLEPLSDEIALPMFRRRRRA